MKSTVYGKCLGINIKCYGVNVIGVEFRRKIRLAGQYAEFLGGDRNELVMRSVDSCAKADEAPRAKAHNVMSFHLLVILSE